MSVTTRSLPQLDPLEGAPVLVGAPDDRAVNEAIMRPIWERTRRGWLAMLGICASLSGLLFFGAGYTVATGIGVWGNNVPVAWG